VNSFCAIFLRMIEKLVIFDWSGTLSPDAVTFAEDDTLTGALKRSGLAALGVADPDTFWSGIVNPTWEEGSTTPDGYGEVITRRIRELFSPAVPDDRIRASAKRFVDSYLAHSPVDGRWSPILEKLGNDSSVITVIATDHYAEATASIVRHLDEMDVSAVPLKNALGASSPFVVANSADIGAHKADRAFWKTIQGSLELDAVRDILVVDDFGFNEGAGDSYGERSKVKTRKETTIALLEDVFGVSVSPVPFIWERGRDSWEDRRACGRVIAQVSGEVKAYLSRR